MKIQHREEHLSCLDYNRPSPTRFKYLTFPSRHLPQSVEIQRSTIVFLLEGTILITCDEFTDKPLHSGEMALFPVHSCCYIKIVTPGRFVSCAFTEPLNFCNRFTFRNLYRHIPEGFRYDYTTLDIHSRLEEFLTPLAHYLEDGIGCTHFHEMKGQELFLLFRAYYSSEVLSTFFFPLLGEEMDFKNWIRGNYSRFLTAKEFAAETHMSTDTFKRTFKKVFRTTFHTWITEQKARLVYRDILMGELSFAEIADRYHFSSQAYLSTFCKKHFEKTPLEVRHSSSNLIIP